MQHGRYPRPQQHLSQPCYPYNIVIFQVIQDGCCTAGKCRRLLQAHRSLSIMQATACMPVQGSSLKVSPGMHLTTQIACDNIPWYQGKGCWSHSGCHLSLEVICHHALTYAQLDVKHAGGSDLTPRSGSLQMQVAFCPCLFTGQCLTNPINMLQGRKVLLV